jgi:hypothetical protein
MVVPNWPEMRLPELMDVASQFTVQQFPGRGDYQPTYD